MEAALMTRAVRQRGERQREGTRELLPKFSELSDRGDDAVRVEIELLGPGKVQHLWGKWANGIKVANFRNFHCAMPYVALCNEL
jgi:hypothetical protein